MENEYVITFPSNMKSDLRTFENILKQVSNIPYDVSVIKYDITKISWVDGELSSFLACIFEYIQSRFKKVSQYVQLNETRSAAETLLIKNKLLPYYLPIQEIPDTYHTTVPFKNFSIYNSDKQVATKQVDDYLKKYVYSHKDWSTNFGDSQEELDFSTSIYELIRNIIDHSRTNKLLISGQFYPTKEEFSLAISDIGVGIPLTVQNQTPGLRTH
ncbi:hypothetical protein JK159_08415 [Weissella minor]|uniref:hypothetical protein n=1 Tax=Weissella minor TaxID=1620 RepID=UPI001BAF0B99|nr:hypothetical protein [Weissella minor]MBS0950377.1 hypothetical protein [Weissella minor]